MSWWQTLLVNGGTGVGLALLAWLLYRARDTQNLAATVMNSMKGQLALVEDLRTALFLQGSRLDEWERWGREVVDVWKDIRAHFAARSVSLPELPAPPEMHLDLSYLFEDKK